MKRLTFKSVFFGLLFAVAAGLMSASVLSESVKPKERISWIMPDSTGDTTDAGIRHPGWGH